MCLDNNQTISHILISLMKNTILILMLHIQKNTTTILMNHIMKIFMIPMLLIMEKSTICHMNTITIVKAKMIISSMSQHLILKIIQECQFQPILVSAGHNKFSIRLKANSEQKTFTTTRVLIGA